MASVLPPAAQWRMKYRRVFIIHPRGAAHFGHENGCRYLKDWHCGWGEA
ncbi:hypothetical protein H9K76_22395 [Diaphorobacter ruginosibacter]|uniref:Uncharacterized protein n=1 Tax=Diaphorobacter ruginosibacter TaxID=1715720 RepID=A0A7G9RNK2_9BURK|nr:hypothetical protein [Diaphorobacter ruginosibacter]QNN57177.1 hypothetical protein H9K76_22395 [Diaphorobacter ruginosibacter]